MEWLRWYHGAISDDKWPLIARKSGQSVAVVVAVWAALLECASQADDRGSIECFDPESIDALFGIEDGATQKIMDALSDGKKPRIVSGRIVKWNERQPKREDGSAERAKDWRERKKVEKASGCQSVNASERTPNAHQTQTNTDKRREEERREEYNTPPKAPPTPEVLPSEQDGFEGEGLNASRPSRQNGTNPRAMGNNPRGNSSNPRATGTNPRAQAELVGDGFDPDCSLEFQELRELYDREGKPEAPMTGHVEFLALCKQRLWPRMPRIAQALCDLQHDGQWSKEGGRFRPGLAKFLRERWWEKQPDTRASPMTEKEQDGIRAAEAAYRLFGNKGGQGNAYSASDTRPTGNPTQGLPA